MTDADAVDSWSATLERGELLWSPNPGAATQMTRFRQWLSEREGVALDNYEDLQRWSVEHLDAFWRAIWDYFEIDSSTPYENVRSGTTMPQVSWFPGSTVNFAEHMLRRHDELADAPAIVAGDESGVVRVMTFGDLHADVRAFGAYLSSLGVVAGDRVAAVVPNTPEAVVAFLACTALGAVWSSVSPEFGTDAVVSRFSELQPKVLLTTDGYVFGGRTFDRRDVVNATLDAVPSIETVIHINPLSSSEPAAFSRPVTSYHDAVEVGRSLPFAYAATSFDHPLLVAFSSGTTGKPKGIVHGHGGLTLEGYKMSTLHADLGPGDVYMFFTSTGWMVWFMVISALCSGTCIGLYDGNPQADGGQALWKFLAASRTTVFGASSAFFAARQAAGDEPNAHHDLSAVRTVCFGASPAAPHVMRWVADNVGEQAMVTTASGGTEIFTCFVGFNPDVPSYAGEFQSTWLATDAVAMAPDGSVVHNEVGDLVIRQPMPSMPVAFLNDPDGARLRAAYFEDFPGLWRHGDLFIQFPEGTSRILGRSDATLNRFGVRIGTAEMYDVVERDEAVIDSLVVNLENPGGGSRMILFVQCAEGHTLDDEAKQRLSQSLRLSASPRHVPDEMVAVSAIPYTITGKKLEVPVKRVLMGMDAATAIQRHTMRDPAAIDDFLAYAANP